MSQIEMVALEAMRGNLLIYFVQAIGVLIIVGLAMFLFKLWTR